MQLLNILKAVRSVILKCFFRGIDIADSSKERYSHYKAVFQESKESSQSDEFKESMRGGMDGDLNVTFAEISLKQFNINVENLFHLAPVAATATITSTIDGSISSFYQSVVKSGNDLFDADDNDEDEGGDNEEKKQQASTMGSLTVILTKLNYLLSIESVGVQVATISLFMLIMDKIRGSK